MPPFVLLLNRCATHSHAPCFAPDRRARKCRYLVTDASEANLFFIPVYASVVCQDTLVGDCGPDPHQYRNFTAIWEFIRQQPSWQASDGSDHFVITDRPWNHVRHCGAMGLTDLPPNLLAGAPSPLLIGRVASRGTAAPRALQTCPTLLFCS